MEPSTAAELSSMPLAPALGYRNYWYPLVESRRVGKRPLPIRILGEDLVLFRAGPQVAALVDRCAHRGARLSLGRTLFPGTISCPYHGWTYDATGLCRASIVEGPESPVAGRARVHAYPTAERFGVVWIFLGEGEPPPLEEDLPPQIQSADALLQVAFEEWACDWRNVTENYPDMLHASYVHRRGPEMILRKVAAWGKMVVAPLADGKGLAVRAAAGGIQAHYPGLGLFPRHIWFRRQTNGTNNSGASAEVRMPGYIILPRRPTPHFNVAAATMQWPVPVDLGRTRIFECTITYPDRPARRLWHRAWWLAYYNHVHRWFFTHQDKRIIESQPYREVEQLAASDAGLVLWRRLAARLAADRERTVRAAANCRQPDSADVPARTEAREPVSLL